VAQLVDAMPSKGIVRKDMWVRIPSAALVTRPFEEVRTVQSLAEAGLKQAEISRRTGIPRVTVHRWLATGRAGRLEAAARAACKRCGGMHEEVDQQAYAYLLGLYLGDGWITRHARDVFALRIALDAQYPAIILSCQNAMQAVVPRNRIAGFLRPESDCIEISAYSKHWPCLFPQHGRGFKHARRIALAPWQRDIVDTYPEQLLRGLVHSDGSRSRNVTDGKNYPRYLFSNRSDDIRAIFCATCDRLGIEWRRANAWNVSVARRASVAKLDAFIGPKR
jgi:hypothetical protein